MQRRWIAWRLMTTLACGFRPDVVASGSLSCAVPFRKYIMVSMDMLPFEVRSLR